MNLNYADLIEKRREIIRYSASSCEKFSVITTMKYALPKIPSNSNHYENVKSLDLFLIDYIPGIKKWPGTETKSKNKALLMYRACKDTGSILCNMQNIFLPVENCLPEDITFYRNGHPWLVTISHEKIACILDCTKNDLDFFKAIGVYL